MDASQIEMAVVVSAPFEENTYIARQRDRDDCLIVDPGLEPDRILEYLARETLSPAAILITHGHSDHIAGNEAMKREFPGCPIVVSRGDAAKLTDPTLNLSAAFGAQLVSPPGDVLVGEGDEYSAAGFDLSVLEIPGHSSGHIVYLWRAGKPMLVFGGDVLFAGSIGRTDFPDGSFEQLAEGIHSKLFTLDDETVILPGHGPGTTVGQEKRNNPFVGAPSGYEG
ncbi:MAG: MBL fold metallo-hydrolase [Planctomycetota bacterium]|nr:MAG: MBL fold metallo-hydrolase [Planctomycetota bacterium]